MPTALTVTCSTEWCVKLQIKRDYSPNEQQWIAICNGQSLWSAIRDLNCHTHLDEGSWLLACMGKKGGARKLAVAGWPTKSLTKQTTK